MSHPLTAYVPYWLLTRLAQGAVIPGHAEPVEAVVLYADIAGFTSLTEALAQQGAEGVEVLSQTVADVFGILVETVYAHGGDVARFFGDAIMAFWPLADADDEGQRATAVAAAVAAAQEIQGALRRFERLDTPAGPVVLSMRVGIGLGPALAMVVGTAAQQRFVLAGQALAFAIVAEKEARRGQVMLHPSARRARGDAARAGSPPLVRSPLDIPPERLRPFVHPALIERIEATQAAFLADFRHGVVPLFVSFDADTAAAIQRYVVQAMDVVNRHGGYLAEVDLGDKGNVLAILFGVPLAQGDHGARAAACALDLSRLPATRAVGATSGTLFAGVVGSERRCQYTAFGDEMNLACRLMEAGDAADSRPPILVSARLRRQAGDRFLYGERREVEIKGKSKPVAVFPLLGRAAAGKDWPALWLGRGALVGRQRELAWLDGQMDAVFGGQSCLVTLVGEAGVGKSRLLGELLRRWVERGGAAYVGAALASTQHSPYFAWGELLRAFFGLRAAENDPARVQVAVTAVNPDFVARMPLLSDVMGLGLPDTDLTRHFDAHLRQQSTQSLVTDLIHHRAARQPLLLALEDAHWLDQLSWEMALAVARASRNLPLLLVLVHRPLDEPYPEAYRAMIGLPHHNALSLGELEAAEGVALACARLGVDALPAALSDLILEKTHGHPFFIEELLLTLIEQGSIQVEQGGVIVRADLQGVALPDTVQGVVQARIDRLDERTRLTLMVASVIGRTFPYRILRDVHPVPTADDSLREQLDRLGRLDITLLESAEPELLYGFKHAVTHEVAYGTLLFAQRRRLHAAVAGWYERTYAERPEGLDPYYALLVHHYRHTDDQPRQVYYLERLARQASARYAAAVAVDAYEQLVAILDEWDGAGEVTRRARLAEMLALDAEWEQEEMPLAGPPPADARSRLGNARFQALLGQEEALGLLGRRAAQLAVIERLQRLARQQRRPDWSAIVLSRKAAYQIVTGALAEAVLTARRGLRAARRSGNVHLQIANLIQGSNALWGMAQYRRARRMIAPAVEMARAVGDRQMEARTLQALAIIYISQNQYQLSRDCLLRASELYRAGGNVGGSAVCLLNLGVVETGEGNHGAALQNFQQALELIHLTGDRRMEGAARQIVAEGFKAVGQHEQAVAWGQQALEMLQSVGDSVRVLHAMHTLVDAWHELGEWEKAAHDARQVVAQSRSLGASLIESFALHSLGRALLSQEQWEAAVQALSRAVELRANIGAPGDRAASLAWLGIACLESGDLAAALQWTAQAVELMEQTGNAGEYTPQEVWWCRYRALAAAGDETAAQRALAEARRLLDEQAAHIDHPDLRRSFLENIRVHRAITTW